MAAIPTRASPIPTRASPIPTPTSMPAMRMLAVEPKMILEIASGVREPCDIAEDYGYSHAQWEELKVYPPFVKLVDDKKLDLKLGGYTFRLKAAMAAEEILTEVYHKAKEDEASFHTQLESLKFLARAAGLDSPPKEEAQAGATFSINIDLGGDKGVHIGVVAPKMPADRPSEEPYYTVCAPAVSDQEAPETDEIRDFCRVFTPFSTNLIKKFI